MLIKKFRFYNLLFLIFLCLHFINSKIKNTNLKKKSDTTIIEEPVVVNINNKNGNSVGSNNDFFDSKKNKYFYRRYIKCNDVNCAYPNSCLDSTTCQCGAGFADRQKQNTNNYCTYEQRKQKTAFLLEFFFPMGIGHFYSKRILISLIKLLFFIIPLVLFCFISYKKFNFKIDNNGNGGAICLLVTAIIIGAMWIIWQIIDLVKFGKNKYSDGNGIPLQSW